jgi:hypothetical protein
MFRYKRRIRELEDRVDELSRKLWSLDYNSKILKYSDDKYISLMSPAKEDDWIYPSTAISIILDHLGIAITRKARPWFEIVDLPRKKNVEE